MPVSKLLVISAAIRASRMSQVGGRDGFVIAYSECVCGLVGAASSPRHGAKSSRRGRRSHKSSKGCDTRNVLTHIFFPAKERKVRPRFAASENAHRRPRLSAAAVFQPARLDRPLSACAKHPAGENERARESTPARRSCSTRT